MKVNKAKFIIKVKSVKKIPYKGKVYNIGTTPEHNYFANNILVHNCYQNSDTKGSHADLNTIENIAYILQEMRVFEVAIGGGEPTSHPDFVDILKAFRKQGVVPNFTTKSMDWMRDARKWPGIIENCGSFAFSVKCVEDIELLESCMVFNGIESNPYWGKRLCKQLHYVMGSASEHDLKEILEKAHELYYGVTLLGYKESGRGSSYTPENNDNWIKICKELKESEKLPRLSIDTVLAYTYEEQILEADIPDRLFDTEDGKFSMYIDAVECKAGPSSYCDGKQMVDLSCSNYGLRSSESLEIIKDAYKTW
jgi:MoaA/NifB/PqqE/SkfB family radical SAM enzyme